MCGICLILYEKCTDDVGKSDKLLQNSRIAKRGPDGTKCMTVQISDEECALFCGHVLHLRGDEMAHQPAKDNHGNMLLWNGEIFGGIEVADNGSDTTVLLEKLGGCTTDEEVTHMMSMIQGPWSFIYWQASSKTFWFGRDVLGRRSLLWHLPENQQDVFSLSSVQIKPWVFKEVPSVGLFKMSVEPKVKYRVSLFPWQHAVWPGTLNRVQDNDNLVEKLYSDNRPLSDISFSLRSDMPVPSQMPQLNKDLPSPDQPTIPKFLDGQTHLEYLQNILKTNLFLKNLSQQLTSVLLEAVRTRVGNQCVHASKFHQHGSRDQAEMQELCVNTDQLSVDTASAQCATGSGASCDTHVTSDARVAVLFSGGIDSTVIAALADKCTPRDEPIDLINVAFELKDKQTNKRVRHIVPPDKRWDVPDRLTGYTALSELNQDRPWNFIEVNVTAEELQEARVAHIQDLVYPLQTVLDDSIGCAVWFAARGVGVLGIGPNKGARVTSSARVILCGMGADEQLVGYSRHRVRFKEEGWQGLIDEIELEVTRISARNLGRDDRIITDHGKESRFPFLDECVVQFLSGLPVHNKANLNLPRGLGEKLLLRLSAVDLGLHRTAVLAKRAIQFGSRIAKLENNKEKASDICSRLLDANIAD